MRGWEPIRWLAVIAAMAAPVVLHARPRLQGGTATSGASDAMLPRGSLEQNFERVLQVYESSWGNLPQVEIANPEKPLGRSDERLPQLRRRLGLSADGGWDAQLRKTLRRYQLVHGLAVNGEANPEMLQSLNAGPAVYEAIIRRNIERAKQLTVTGKYVVVDSAAARLWMYSGADPVASMRVIVGSPKSPTPIARASIGSVILSPSWTVPPDLARNLIAPHIVKEGARYLTDRNYQVFSDWTPEAIKLNPASVNWQALAAGNSYVRLQRGPGPWNPLGEMKFLLPNPYGVYLHDVPEEEKTRFAADDRWLSNGCVRLANARQLAKWLLGTVPATTGEPDQQVDLPAPIPIFLTYFTIAPQADGQIFLPDVYHVDVPGRISLAAAAPVAQAILPRKEH